MKTPCSPQTNSAGTRSARELLSAKLSIATFNYLCVPFFPPFAPCWVERNQLRTIMRTNVIRRLSATTLLTIGFALGVLPCAATSYTWNNGSGDWSVAANWTPNGVPGPNDAASISFGTLTVGTDTTVSNLNFTGGTINGAAVLTVGSLFNWPAGTMSGSGITTIASGATATLAAANTATLGRTMVNAGTITLDGVNTWSFSPGVVFTNQSGGVFNVTQGATFGGDGTPGFHNEGTFTKSSAFISRFNGVTFHNRNIVNVLAGLLEHNSGGTHTGDFTVASGATLNFNGTHSLSAAVDITGAGNLTVAGGNLTDAGTVNTATGGFSGGTATFTGSYSNSTSLTVNGGTVNFNVVPGLGPTTAVNLLAPIGGMLSINGDLTITGSLTWTHGTMSGPGITTLAVGTVNTISAVDAAFLARPLINAGTVTLIGANSWGFNACHCPHLF